AASMRCRCLGQEAHGKGAEGNPGGNGIDPEGNQGVHGHSEAARLRNGEGGCRSDQRVDGERRRGDQDPG
ncbi:hypothetical protein PENTCL1PPCAC_28340, partial [Pristionchus entomophagus]